MRGSSSGGGFDDPFLYWALKPLPQGTPALIGDHIDIWDKDRYRFLCRVMQGDLVLKTLIKRCFPVLVFSMLCCSAGSFEAEGVASRPTRVVVDGLELVLEGCTLRAGEQTEALGLPGPCQFSVDREGKPDARKTEYGTCLVVMSITPIEDSEDCDTVFRGVLVRNGSFWVSASQQNVAMCDDGPLDAKVFSIFASEISGAIPD